LKPIYKDVSSSNIQALAYADGKGFVEFGGGRRFAYTMPRAVFNEMESAKSIGSYFARNVKGHYEVAWTGQRCSLMSCRNDATLAGEVAGGKFFLCDACSKDGRYTGFQFTPYAPPEARK
jgi:hypothetical protein